MADPGRPRHYEEEFKRRIVQLYENGKPAREIRTECDISRSTCTGGCGGPQQRFDQGGRQPHAGAERADRVEGAQPPVGDGGGCFRTSGAGIRTKAEAIRSDAGRCPISAQCRILGVAKSTYCWMLGHPETERADPHEEDVGRVWRDSGKIYGGRKIKHAPGHEGIVMKIQIEEDKAKIMLDCLVAVY